MIQLLLIVVIVFAFWDRIKYLLGKYQVLDRLSNAAVDLKEYAEEVDYSKKSIEEIDEKIIKIKEHLQIAVKNEDIETMKNYITILEKLKEQRIEKTIND